MINMIRTKIRKILKIIFWGKKYNSKSYVRYLQKIGANVDDDVYFVAPSKTLIDETRPYLLSIGKNTTITEGVAILTHGFDWSVLKVAYGNVLGSAGKVSIGDNCFIGVNTIILKGCSIGNNTIIGAGSVVTSNIPDNVVAAGNPCKVICPIQDYYEKRLGAQIREGKELLAEYYRRYKTFPPVEEMSEFFWLFASEKDINNACFDRKMRYGNNYDKTMENYMKSRINRNYDSYELLCNEVKRDEGL